MKNLVGNTKNEPYKICFCDLKKATELNFSRYKFFGTKRKKKNKRKNLSKKKIHDRAPIIGEQIRPG